MRDRFTLRAVLTIVALVGALLLLIHPRMPATLAQVGADARPKPTPKPSVPKTQPKRAITRSTQPPKFHPVDPQIEMVLIPAGTFLMGSPDGVGDSAEHPQHRVTVQSFFIGKYEVTQAQYKAVLSMNPSNFKGDKLPVENVSWNDAKDFCRKLSQITGREYRLPSEAEWEYACRAGTTGDYTGNFDAMAWYSKNSGGKTHPVGQRQPNAFGLYDMQGNVLEWCEDWYENSYDRAPTDGSALLSAPSERERVLRGGSWNSLAAGLHSAYRTFSNPEGRSGLNGIFGLRVAAAAKQ